MPGNRHGHCITKAARNAAKTALERAMARYRRKFWFSLAALTIALAAAVPARAQDKVTVGVFPVSSSLPYFVALDRGFFKEQNIAPDMVKLMGGPPNIAAMMTNQIEA